MADEAIPGQEPINPAVPTPALATPAPETEDELVKLIKADPNRTAEEIRALRKEAAEHRKKAEKAEADRKASEDKKLAEQGEYKTLAEKKDAELAELKETVRKDKIKSAVLLEATRAGVIDPEAAYVLADLSGANVSETGAVTGAVEAVAALVKAKPYLIQSKQPGAPNIGATNPASGGPSLTRDDVRNYTPQQWANMTPEEYNTALLALKK